MKTFKSFIVEEKKATITKKESYRGRTTADVEYNVLNYQRKKCIKNIRS